MKRCCDCKWQNDLEIDGYTSCPFRKVCEEYDRNMFEPRDSEGKVKSVDKFVNRIQSVIKASRMCNEISYAAMLGAIELIKFDILQEMLEDG